MARKTRGARVPSTTTILRGLRWLDKLATGLDTSEIVALVRAAMLHAEGRAPKWFYAYMADMPFELSEGDGWRARLRDALVIMNGLLEAQGVEYIESAHDGYGTSDYGIEYLNVGDPYVPTVIYDHGEHAWSIAAWGDIVEERPEDFGGD